MSRKKSRKSNNKIPKNKTKEKPQQGVSKTVIGHIDLNSSGNGYLISDQLPNDAFIAQGHLKTAQNKDQVEATVTVIEGKRKIKGRVTKILKRHREIFTGVLRAHQHGGNVEIMDRGQVNCILNITNLDDTKAKDGELVVAQVTQWNSNQRHSAEIIDVLGQKGEHHADIKSILVDKGLPYGFPKDVEDYATAMDINIHEKEVSKRRDMREVFTLTIDPKDAKDFDDAISFQQLPNGNYEIGIHIADVSHFVTPDSILDEEAFDRATSIYLVDRVIPMLPEVLSNKACSLRPLEDKYTFSAIFEIDNNAAIVNHWYGKTAIQSDLRLAYEEAQQVIETDKGDIPAEISLSGEAYTVNDEVVTAITTLNRLAKILCKKRMQNGAISFDKIEVGFVLDDDNNPVEVVCKKSKDANKLIEEYMLLANRSVAEYIGKELKKTFVYRIHDEPDFEKLVNLQGIAGNLGHQLNLKSKKQISQTLNTLLSDVKGQKEQNLIDTLAIRTMSKASYSTHNIGHYGLAFDYYTHFTSPIRRYPDIMVHRLLQSYLEKKRPYATEESLEEYCKHSSSMEILAVQAERDSIKYMQIKYLEKYINHTFEGVITGVTDRGIYVEIVDNKCEGMIRLRDIKDDIYDFDPKTYRIIGRNTGNSHQLGDDVQIKIKKLDLEKRHIDFSLITTNDTEISK